MFIDSHCHVNFACFDEQRDKLISSLAYQQIDKLIIPATHRSTWQDIIDLCCQYPNLYYSLGYHPHFLDHYEDGDLIYLQALVNRRERQCIAIGEIGLDKRISTDMRMQEDIFIEQVKIAEKFKLPIILHVVQKQGRVLEILRQLKFTQGGVYHAFSGSEDIALAFIALGFKIGVGGVVTYPNALKTRKTLRLLPVESLILETDSPDMPVYKQRDKVNTPLNLLPIFTALAELRSESKECLAKQLYQNTLNIFSCK
ncbi:TatD family hydrolase [Psychromonas sp. MME2]|uniref:TatD family hydrolase n=1 Tax=unclassified Psychromonas TaxID=2614957 RepID=UPI00339CBDA1